MSAPTIPKWTDYSLVPLAQGGHSLRSERYGEVCHPVDGPALEARRLYVEASGLENALSSYMVPLVIWDIGMGGAANVCAALEALNQRGGALVIHSFEQDSEPLDFAIAHQDHLDYPVRWSHLLKELLEHQSVEYHGENWSIQWTWHKGCATQSIRNLDIPPSFIFQDAYSPSVNPELWTLDWFRSLRQACQDETPCILTTYSRATSVRTALLLAGWHVGYGPASGPKEETTQASNQAGILKHPLDRRWLDRALRSHAASPLRAGIGFQQSPLSEEEEATLLQLWETSPTLS